MRPLLVLALLAAPAGATDRMVGIGSFDRLRVDGPLEVRVTTGTSPAVRISGGRDAVEAVDVTLDGRTLTIRPGRSAWGERPRSAGAEPVTVAIGTPSLTALSSIAGARITATGANGDRIDLSLTGPGAIKLADAAAADLTATLIGTGTIDVAGHSQRARLVINGPGRLDAAGLEANELTARLEGPGELHARARYTAQVSNAGLGTVTIAGRPKCTVRSPAGGRVTCGE